MGESKRAGWYHGWTIVLVCVLAGFAANALLINSYSLFLVEWARDFHTQISDLQIGIMFMGFGCALVSPLIGSIADRWPPRLIIAGGLIAIAVMAFGMSVAQSKTTYLLLYGLVGPFALCMATSLPANVMVARWFVRHRGLALACTSVGLGLAGVIMPPIVAHLMPIFGWRQIWLASGVISLVVLLPLVLITVRDRRESDSRVYMDGDMTAVSHHGHGTSGGAATLRIADVFKRRNFWVLIVTFIPMLALYGGGGQNLAPIATSRGLGAETAGLLMSLYSAAHVLAMLVGGALSDRIGNRLPMAGLAFLTAAGGLLIATSSHPALLALGAIGIGCGGAFWPLVASAIALEYGAANMGRAFGMLTLFLPLTGIVPFAVARLQEDSGSYAPALLGLAAIVTVCGVICLLLLREKRPATMADRLAGTIAEPAVGPA